MPNLLSCQTKLELLWHGITALAGKFNATGFVCAHGSGDLTVGFKFINGIGSRYEFI